VVELDGLVHDRGIAAVVPLPELLAQDGDGLRILAVGRVGGNEVAAQERSQAEELEVGSRHLDRDYVVGYVTARHCLVRIVGGDHILDGVGLP
jgi:hypothetical protein